MDVLNLKTFHALPTITPYFIRCMSCTLNFNWGILIFPLPRHHSFAMSRRNLDSLPVELLQQIAGLLRDTNRPSFNAFTVTNKLSRLACLPLIFQELHVSVNDSITLQNNVDLLLKLLSSPVCGGDVTQYVRHLCLKDSLCRMKTDDSEGAMPAPDEDKSTANHEKELQKFRSTGLNELLDENEPLVHAYLGEDDPFVTHEQDAAWTPIANLIKTLPRLTRLVYDCRNQFPPCLLDALHSHHPQCRLYHHTFRLRSLRSKFDRVIDPHELAVATSPCLYRVKLRYSIFNEDAEEDRNLRAIQELTAGLAPNLKEVFVVHVKPPKTQHPRPEPPWDGLPGFVRGQVGSLTLLSITGCVLEPDRSPKAFRDWAKHTNFSLLRHLSLGGEYLWGTRESTRGLRTAALDFMARACSFPQLESLHILLIRRDPGPRHEFEDVDPQATPKFINAATAFFNSLPPLEKLSVAGSIMPEIFDTILRRHGRRLLDLKIYPFEDLWARWYDCMYYIPMTITPAHILQIKTECPRLESLSIYIKRSMSDPTEVQLYTSLAQIEPLHHLFLTLDCSNWPVSRDRRPDKEHPAWFDEDDKKTFSGPWICLKRGYVRQNMINAAVDEDLARSIWDVIAKHKLGKRLLSLKLYTAGVMNFGWPGTVSGMADVAHHLSRSWLIERGIRDDEQDVLYVRELGRQAREARDEELHDKFENGDEQRGIDVFRRIWPEKEVGKCWINDWKSFPLQI